MGDIIEFKKRALYEGDDTMLNDKKQNTIDIENVVDDISVDRKNQIEKEVQKILKKNRIVSDSYVDIVSIVKKDDFLVKPIDMDIETTGIIYVNNKIKLIAVNKTFKNPDKEDDVIFKKSRFITAHEYGHYILHTDSKKTIFAHRDTYHRTDPNELEADYFARSLLMPLDKFRNYYTFFSGIDNNNPNFVLTTLSGIFKVTRNKVAKRIEDLSALQNI